MVQKAKKHWKLALALLLLLAPMAWAIKLYQDPGTGRARVVLGSDNDVGIDLERTFATVAALTAATDLQDGTVYYTQGYSAAGDDGANAYIYHATGRPSADGGFYLDGAGADDYVESLSKEFYAPWFGCLPNGSDMSGEFKAVIDAARTRATAMGGATVTFAGGQHIFDTSGADQAGIYCYVSNAITLKGSGKRATAFRFEGMENDDVLMKFFSVNGGGMENIRIRTNTSSATGIIGLQLSDVSSSTFRDFAIDFQEALTAGGGSIGIQQLPRVTQWNESYVIEKFDCRADIPIQLATGDNVTIRDFDMTCLYDSTQAGGFTTAGIMGYPTSGQGALDNHVFGPGSIQKGDHAIYYNQTNFATRHAGVIITGIKYEQQASSAGPFFYVDCEHSLGDWGCDQLIITGCSAVGNGRSGSYDCIFYDPSHVRLANVRNGNTFDGGALPPDKSPHQTQIDKIDPLDALFPTSIEGGTSSYLTTDTPPVTAPPFTIAFWCKLPNLNSQEIWSLATSSIDEDEYFSCKVFTNGLVSKVVNSSTGQIAVGGDADRWLNDTVHFVCCVVSASNSRSMYFTDETGALLNSSNSTNITNPPSIDQFSIGALYDQSTSTATVFRGHIQDLMIWNRALTAAEITSLHNNDKGLDSADSRIPLGMVAHYPLDVNRGSILTDVIGGNDLTEVGSNITTGEASLRARRPRLQTLVGNQVTMTERSADPDDPPEGQTVIWQSDGTGSGDDGDIMVKITAGGSTKTTTLLDFSAL